ncbi:hypothetical protein BJF93_09450 [Xaviernesmea oryzae]|uniref:HTH luxR-type domain-containing protein n=1 Tax=Xaviernesmea oryzae TaxID=464029 RepID=A0A1Q9AWL0_9HYPH|nr:hypothetical protein BJF93_09450 [Xaviernesmea oryzae]
MRGIVISLHHNGVEGTVAEIFRALMMSRMERFHAAADLIQEAVVDPSLWPSTLSAISDSLDLAGINIMEPITQTAFSGVMVTDSLQGLLDDYVREEWHLRDYRACLLPITKQQSVVLEQSVVAPSTYETHEYYRFLEKYGLRLSAVIDFSVGDQSLYFVMQRRLSDGFDGAELPLFEHIASRLRTGARLMRALTQSRVQGMLTAFDRMATGCLLFNKAGQVVETNATAERLVAEGHLAIRRNQLEPWLSSDARALHGSLKAALGGNSLERKPVLLSTRRGSPLVVRIEPFGTRLVDAFYGAAAFALVEDTGARGHSHALLKQVFGLTSAEAMIADLVAQGYSPTEIATRQTIHYETVRSHLRSIFRKTETSRQAELSALLGNLRIR